MEKLSGTKTDFSNRIRLSKNMLVITFGFCDLKTNFTLRNVVRQFRQVIDSETDFPIFSYFILVLDYTRSKLFNYPFKYYSEGSYLNDLAKSLREKKFQSSQVDHFLSQFLICIFNGIFQNLSEIDLGIVDNTSIIENLRVICFALKDNHTVKD